MKAIRWDDEEFAHFAVADLEPPYEPVVELLGFHRGPKGFEKKFSLSSHRVETAFANFARSIEPMVKQTAEEAPVLWEEALRSVAPLLDKGGVNWWIVGSAATAVRGVEVAVRDLDIVVDEAKVGEIDSLLEEYVVEPTTPTPGWIASWFGRAFINARVEWVAGNPESADDPQPTEAGPVARGQLEKVDWQGLTLRVPPLYLQLDVSRRRGLYERVDSIGRFMASQKSTDR